MRSDGHSFLYGGLELSAPQVLLDGEVLDAQVQQLDEVEEDEDREGHLATWLFHLPDLKFETDVTLDPTGVSLSTTLHAAPDFSPLSFGLRFRVGGVSRFLQMGYHSWDGSGYRAFPPVRRNVEVGAHGTAGQPAQPGYALTQLFDVHGSVLQLGFLRHDRVQHTFRLIHTEAGDFLDIETLWDRQIPDGSGAIGAEPLLISSGDHAEVLLERWAERVAAASPLPPRHTAPLTGWSSWYNLYAAITEENILEHLRDTQRVRDARRLNSRVFQIDDGFTPEMGDWLEVKPQFPRGMKPLLSDIRAAGFVPGLWIAPFLAGNRSRLYDNHPDWVVRDRRSGGPLICMSFYGEFRWHKRSEEYYLLDTTHPDAMQYLRDVFRTWRQDWGAEYFKTDFMFYGAEYGPERVRRYGEGQSRIQIWLDVARMIREEIGDAQWVGCGTPLWPGVGLMDAVRTGRDVGASWDTGLDAAERLENLAVRNFGHGRLWQADPDCVLLRERFHHLTPGEVDTLALYSGMTGGLVMTSDQLGQLGEQRLALWQLLLSGAGGRCQFPLLGNVDSPWIVQTREVKGGVAIHVLNLGSEEIRAGLRLRDLHLPKALRLQHWRNAPQLLPAEAVEAVTLSLPARSSTLLFGSETGEQVPPGLALGADPPAQ